MTDSTAEIAQTYFRAWQSHDFELLRSILADDVTFAGPLGQAADADSCIEGLKGMSTIMTRIEIRQMCVTGPDVITWFDLYTNVTGQPCPTANWSHVENGKITRIRATFDPRPLLPPG
jgi:hypothetical protein